MCFMFFRDHFCQCGLVMMKKNVNVAIVQSSGPVH